MTSSEGPFHDVEHTGVLGIVILPDHRGNGLGEAMIMTALKRAIRIGARLVELQVFATNSTAIHLFEKLGFLRVGVVPNKMLRKGRHIDEIAMYNNLRKR